MAKAGSPQKPLVKTRFFLLCLSFLPAVCLSQALNGSFETDGQPSLEHWSVSCNGEAFRDAPSGGGNWSLRLPTGNFQGCFPGIGSQIVREFRDGEIWQVSVWARQDEKKLAQTSVYLKVFHGQRERDATVLSVASTTSAEWTQLTVVDTLFLDEGDSVAIVLDAGSTSGPDQLESNSYFDLVTAKKIGEMISTSINDSADLPPEDFKLLPNYPNPFNPSTTISYDLPRDAKVSLRIYNLFGQAVRTLANEAQARGHKSVVWNGKDDSGKAVGSGIYICKLEAGGKVQHDKMLILK
jgi:hypothetical protein